jgi:protein-S-isoprenylcysteine O-methyltransferase Ste14
MATPMYLLVALVVFVLAGLALAVARRDYRLHGRLRALTSALLFLVFVAVCPVMGYLGGLGPWPRMRGNPVLYWAGSLLAIGSFGACLVGMAILGLGRTFGHEVNTVTQSGLYRYTRNPQVVFGALGFAGIGLASATWNGLIFALLFAAVSHVMVLGEEEHLRRAHGEAYVEYCKRTPRYFGLPARHR